MKMNLKEEMSTTKLVDLGLAYLIKVGAIILLKIILMSIGTQYDITFLANISWKYFFGIIATFWIISSGLETKITGKQDKDEKNPFVLTARSATHLIVLLMNWGIFSIIAQLFK